MDSLIRSDDVQTVWPSRIGALNTILYAVDQRRNLDRQAQNTLGRDIGALGIGPGRFVENFVLDIRGKLPQISRMRFFNVDHVEMCDVAVLLVNTIELGNSRAERRSSVASENQNDRLLACDSRKLDHIIAMERRQFEVGRNIARLQGTRASGHP